jgi:hypothetical protein
MDYHAINNADFLEDYHDKPFMFWGKAQFLKYISYLDNLQKAVKSDYKKIAEYQKRTKKPIISQTNRQYISSIIIDFAKLKQIIKGTSDQPLYPTGYDHPKQAEQLEIGLEKSSRILKRILKKIGAPSESQEVITEDEEKNRSVFSEMSKMTKWGVIGMGLVLGYKIIQELK